MGDGNRLAAQTCQIRVKATPFHPVRNVLPSLRVSFLLRVSLAVAFAFFAHLFNWEWLRFATSEVILRASACLGLASRRVSFDTIAIQGSFFQFVTSCTFVDVVIGSLPLVWNDKAALSRNLLRLGTTAAALFLFNVVRLEIGQMLFIYGAPWVVADSILGGISYFAVWLVLTDPYRERSTARQLQEDHC